MQPNAVRYFELTGSWQSYRFFDNYTNEIREQLTFKIDALRRVHSFFRCLAQALSRNCSTIFSHPSQTNITQAQLRQEIASTGFKWVGVHIRRGDFLRVKRNVSSPAFVISAMDHFIHKYGVNRTIFLVTGDEKGYCLSTYGNLTNVFITPKWFAPKEDLALLAACSDTIVTVGTFGWWGGFLSGGEVLHDRRSPTDHRPADVNCKGEEFFPKWFSFLNKTV
ncbi:unnamed protein product [Didymodactylos carnosus]|uniref:L-Fucosyltransferase n=1 Tax=Didymodactylos carnosus TaxID=1234261 RepID=A0A815IVE4_9BILA|nr:unnamed protein product [Didymodactylos carnosus]CAF1373958.1 unnamed protein product [Didymodactylos carnosus]CAF3969998.1 unnamed protein product [Didymodactylos carnosus]CAF4262870.1 unnamed protein product [Didymodactylos carnosus]